ncbi:MAG TPA: hypothetical protein PKB12_06080, partial [Elusimicrobiota bacterium]|nr:hypothetical protein [Elusimicrobiota bacterium]
LVTGMTAMSVTANRSVTTAMVVVAVWIEWGVMSAMSAMSVVIAMNNVENVWSAVAGLNARNVPIVTVMTGEIATASVKDGTVTVEWIASVTKTSQPRTTKSPAPKR